jgi:lysophospholipase L1-like esterase
MRNGLGINFVRVAFVLIVVAVASFAGVLWAADAPAGGAAVAAVTANQPATSTAPIAITLKKGDRVAIVGDSITEQKLYSRLMEDYLVACTPQLDLWVIQLGWGGETAGGFLARMDNDLLTFKPTVATTCYGMNDGGYRAYAPATGDNYRKNTQGIIDKAKAAGVRMVVGSPGAVDTTYFKNCPVDVYNNTLGQLGAISRELAVSNGQGYANVHDAMMSAMIPAKAALGAEYPVCGKDGFHPMINGHVVMAYALLKALGVDGQIATITVDMAGPATASDGHKVLSSAAGTAEIESTRYPFCFYGDEKAPDSTRSILPYVPFNQDLNRFTLAVKNLKADRAKVAWGQQSKTFSRAQLEKGINLAAEFAGANPFSEAFKDVDNLVAGKQNFETNLVKGTFHNLSSLVEPDDAEGLAAVKTLLSRQVAKQTKLIADVRAAVVPVKHTITVTAE